MSYYAIVFLVSGIVWIFLTLFLGCNAYEQRQHHHPAYFLIMSIFTLQAALRTIWFFLSSIVGKSHSDIVILNRIPQALQFTGLSILVLLWARALTIRRDNDQQRVLDIAPAMKYGAIFINIVVWAVTISSIAISSSTNRSDLYLVNILFISCLCSLEAVTLLSVGIHTGLKIQQELSPVYISGSHTHSKTNEQNSFHNFIELFKILFFKSSLNDANRYRLQSQILNKIMRIACVCFVFYLIQSISYMYEIIMVQKYHRTEGSTIASRVLYPYFFYELPEMVPELAIVMGISTPDMVSYQFLTRLLCRSADDTLLTLFRVTSEKKNVASSGVRGNLQSSMQTTEFQHDADSHSGSGSFVELRGRMLSDATSFGVVSSPILSSSLEKRSELPFETSSVYQTNQNSNQFLYINSKF